MVFQFDSCCKSQKCFCFTKNKISDNEQHVVCVKIWVTTEFEDMVTVTAAVAQEIELHELICHMILLMYVQILPHFHP